MSLIGSRFLANNSTYKAYLLTNGLSDDSLVRVAFGSKGGQQMTIEDVGQNQLKELNFTVSKE